VSNTNSKPMKTLLVLSQVYPPDPASVGQHVADAASEMVKRGYRVVVLTSARGYDDPTQKYTRKETVNGVEIRRLPLSSFGKKSIFLRLLGQFSFLMQCLARGILTRDLKSILVSTSPPMCSIAAIVIGTVRRAAIKYWVMDINPDQLIAMGGIKESALAVKAFNLLNRMILRRATNVIALDRFMAKRTIAKVDVSDQLAVMPPWPHEDYLDVVKHEDNPFREEHSLSGKFVIMYSGNHSIVHPITTLLEAAVRHKDDPRLVFMFIGGGLAKKDVERTIENDNPGNIITLPYQPIEDLKYSLSAADIHVVSMGNEMVGIVHPCKVYGAMAVARPLLLLGPRPCHASEIIDEYNIGWCIEHGDVDQAVSTIKTMLDTSPSDLADLGKRAQEVISTKFSKERLCGKFCDLLEDGMKEIDQTTT